MEKYCFIISLLFLPISFTDGKVDAGIGKTENGRKPITITKENFVWEKPSKRLLDLVSEFEGFSDTVYLCPSGYRTIGYGHRTSSMETISHKDALELLSKDLIKTHKVMRHLVPNNLSEAKYEALLSLCYNIGVGNFEESTLRKMVLEDSDNIEIASEFAKWRKGGGKVLNGLVKRREAETRMYFPNMGIHKCMGICTL